MTYRVFIRATLAMLALVYSSVSAALVAEDPDKLQNLESWSETSAMAKRLNAPIVLLVEQRNCAFCQRLKREVFRPMANDASYFGKVIFASVLIDFDAPQIEKEGEKISGFEFADIFDASTTPTVLFLDHSSNKLQVPLIGYASGVEYNKLFFKRIHHSIEIIAPKTVPIASN